MSGPFSDTAATAARGFGATVENEELDADYSMVADEYPDEVDYYALLGLSKEPPPTEAEIRSAYRNLSLSFHPDKQPPHLREAANQHFGQIQEAYDALIDPKKRTVYDMLGAEGVRREWGHGGAMGLGGEAQIQDVGVKTMAPKEFRQWFLKAMKKRERKAVENLVRSKGTIIIGINASNTIRVDNALEELTIHVPSPQLSSFGAKYQFKAPLPLPGFLAETGGNDEDEKQDQEKAQSAEDTTAELGDFGELTIAAGIAGGLGRQTTPYIVEYEDGTQEELQLQGAPYLAAKDIHLGATIVPNFSKLAGSKRILTWRPFTFLRDSKVSIEGEILPVPSLKTSVNRSIQPVAGTRPFSVTATTTITHSLYESPPALELEVTKQVTKQKIAFAAWSSGSWGWPEFFSQRFTSLGMSPETLLATHYEVSSFQLGLLSLPERKATLEDDGEDEVDDDDTLNQLQQKRLAAHRAAESWQTYLQATPDGCALILKYSRNLFTGKPSDDPVRSEWSSEGYFPMPRMEEARAVRLEIRSVIAQDLTPSWTVQGTRKVGEYTTVGLGVGIAHTGVSMTVSWNRLGQGFNIPIIVCPANEANQGAAVFATLAPWLAYCAIEFGYIRPRDRRNRRQAAARRHNELKKRIPQKRTKSLEAIELMSEQVQRRQGKEAKQDGLVITKAEYGYDPSTSKKLRAKFPDSRLIDVTIPVAALVEQGQLGIPQDTIKFHLMGFYDPAPLLPKRLRVWYTFQGHPHFVDVGEKEGVSCPMRTHLLSA
ncbi:hypothetical protein N7466_000642 [Penicillium verhagenii]|uniref:uncharacterized protein n=1 Tax=Penicillium verhagenii TaxID=1562060 RepID=UPI002544F26C|nr:uncharacterized protein N7466_000642 [Penicillium verhagenii]KAJ5947627.1 hypothetical protein N7466_000642 [Penicillium verhagenii]